MTQPTNHRLRTRLATFIKVAMTLVILGIASGCSDPVAQCTELMSALCSGCEGEAKTTCVDAVNLGSDCESAVDVGDNYDACMEAVEGRENCVMVDSTMDMPSSCLGVILQ